MRTGTVQGLQKIVMATYDTAGLTAVACGYQCKAGKMSTGDAPKCLTDESDSLHNTI